MFKPSSKIFVLTVPRRYIFCGLFVGFFCLVFLMLSPLFIAALWSPAWKGLTSWLFLVMLIVFFLIFNVIFCLRCGTWLYYFLIFAVVLTFIPQTRYLVPQKTNGITFKGECYIIC